MPEDLWRFAIGPMFSMNVVVVVTAADAAQLDFQYGSVCAASGIDAFQFSVYR
jgi:hypothetical protein